MAGERYALKSVYGAGRVSVRNLYTLLGGSERFALKI
jgi:hypothetical protein